jgi:hypothetical protein
MLVVHKMLAGFYQTGVQRRPTSIFTSFLSLTSFTVWYHPFFL